MATRKKRKNPEPNGAQEAFLANVLILALLVAVWALNAFEPELYRQSLQEDELLEWATFWAFLGACGVAFLAGLRHRHATGRVPWFLAGMGLFCLFVALEEISWGQRVLGYRPPVYFLENNFQQELNLHNVMATSLRKFVLRGVILGYGVLLPCVVWIPPLRRLADRLAIVLPPVALIPTFFATFLTYQIYPWDLSGEIVELMLGLGLLFALLVAHGRYRAQPVATGHRLKPWMVPLLASLAILLLGGATAEMSRLLRRSHPGNVELAKTETEALKGDYLALAWNNKRRLVTKCGLHKRIYSYVEKYGQTGLLAGKFAALTEQGLPEERAAFFLDPWNSPYWIRHKCSKSRRSIAVFVYSFGPDRRRDSSQWELKGDDVGAMIFTIGSERSSVSTGTAPLARHEPTLTGSRLR